MSSKPPQPPVLGKRPGVEKPLTERDPLVQPQVSRPRYELVLTGDLERGQTEPPPADGRRSFALETAWQSFQVAVITIVIAAIVICVIVWGFVTAKNHRIGRGG